MNSNDQSPLGKATGYPDRYDASLLFAIERAAQREVLGLRGTLPFAGADLWTAYEISWLDAGGKPQLAVGELRIPADSPATVESKSLKLYLGSFAQEPVATRERLAQTITGDLDRICRAGVEVMLHPATVSDAPGIAELPGLSLDGENVAAAAVAPEPALLIGGYCDGRRDAPERALPVQLPCHRPTRLRRRDGALSRATHRSRLAAFVSAFVSPPCGLS